MPDCREEQGYKGRDTGITELSPELPRSHIHFR